MVRYKIENLIDGLLCCNKPQQVGLYNAHNKNRAFLPIVKSFLPIHSLLQITATSARNFKMIFGGIRDPLPLQTQVYRFIPVLLCSLWILAGALVITNGRMPDPQEVHPLPDLLFELFPKVAAVEVVTDVIIFLLNVGAIMTMLKICLLARSERGLEKVQVSLYFDWLTNAVNTIIFGVVDSGKRPYKLQGCCSAGLIRFLASYTVVTFFRAIVIVMTSYPATDNHCQHPRAITHPLLNMVLTLVTMGSGAIHCGDLMYSGHTIILCLSCSMLWEYGVYVHRYLFRVIPPLMVIFSFYCIVASRSHYTDDILVSAYITLSTFMVIRHSDDGAPWQLQLLIRYWPCLGSNVREESAQDVAVVVVSPDEAQRERLSEQPAGEPEQPNN
eukprot:gene6175-4453_t